MKTPRNTPICIFSTFLNSLLRGISQVMLQNNWVSGLVFLIGIFFNSTLLGIGAFVGALVSTLTAHLIKADATSIKNGLFGFNGVLVAIALLHFLDPSPLVWGYMIFATSCSTVIAVACMKLTDTWKIPAFTFPFVVTTLCFLLAHPYFGAIHSNENLPTANFSELSVPFFLKALPQGVSQVFFQKNTISGILFLIALLISSGRSFLLGVLGSTVGIIVAWGMGADQLLIGSGVFGFNAVLTAIAVGDQFHKISLGAVFYVLSATILATVMFATLSTAFAPIGVPPLTLPFVLVSWIFLLSKLHTQKSL